MACTFTADYNGCGCPVGYFIPLVTIDGDDITSWPVNVLNINGVDLGQANTPSEYIVLWNSDSDNQQVGTLYVGGGAFCFYIKMRSGVFPLEFVLGEAVDLFVLATEDDVPLSTEDGNMIEI